jgi:hypothetical protein
MLDSELVFAEIWTHSDPIENWRRRRIRCAEVLVPDKVNHDFLEGVHVSCEEASAKLREFGITLHINKDSHLFFQ